ncbi:TPA: ParB/RepB/Spo0J family partition protein [Klebsiella pneumoniae]
MSAFTKKISKLSQIQQQATALPGERIEAIDPKLVDCETQIRSKGNPGLTVESLTELGDDMKRDGQHEPAIVRKHPTKPGRYLMVAGERRWRASKIAGIKLKVVVREVSDEQARRIQRAENIQRENLTQLEIATALSEDRQRLGTLEKVAAEWNKSINWVSERIRFLDVVQSEGEASKAVTAGITADISAINDLHRLEKTNSQAAKEVVKQASADPSLNIRKAVREKLKDAKPAGRQESDKANEKVNSRMRENTTTATQLEPAATELVMLAEKQAEQINGQLEKLLSDLQQRPDVRDALGDVFDDTVQAGKGLQRMREALAALSKGG